MEAYDPETVFSSIDVWERYAYRNNLVIAGWNLARFAEALLPLFSADDREAISLAERSFEVFRAQYDATWSAGMRAKLGLSAESEAQVAQVAASLIDDLLVLLQENHVDYTSFFRHLSQAARGDAESVRRLFVDAAGFGAWLSRWQEMGPDAELMDRVNPIYIPRNHLVEESLTAGTAGDLGRLKQLLDAVTAHMTSDRASGAMQPRLRRISARTGPSAAPEGRRRRRHSRHRTPAYTS
jgi:uncharacterized protein YdiU (UPF0061 family)